MTAILHLLLFIFWVVYTALYIAGVWDVSKWLIALLLATMAMDSFVKFLEQIQ